MVEYISKEHRMGKLSMTFVYSTFLFLFSNAQSYFEIFPNLGGFDNQSQLFNLFVEGDSIYALGDFIDTTIDPKNQVVRPWLATFDLYGNQLHVDILNDTITHNSFFTRKNQFVPFKSNHLYFTETFNKLGNVRATLMEISLKDGDIIKSKAYFNPIDSNEYISPRSLAIWPDNSDNLVLATTIEYSTISQGYILIVDSDFNILNEVTIEDNGRDNTMYKIKVESDSTIILIGNSRKRNDQGVFKDIKPYYMKIDYSGNILKFNLLTGFSNPTIYFGPADSQTILDIDNGWVISCVGLFPTGNCSDCNYTLPFIISLSDDFGEIFWSQTFNEDSDYLEQKNLVNSLIETKEDKGYIMVGYNYNKPNHDSYIFKVSNTGDSLWSRHFIPLNWDKERVLWAILEDVENTKYNTLVAGGTVFDLDSVNRRSWIIHLDSLGCLIPGCELVNSAEEENESGNYILFYPNPVSGSLYILSLNHNVETLFISLLTSQGIEVKFTRFTNEFNKNYLLDVSNIIPGIYIVKVVDSFGKIIQSERIVVK